MLLLFCFVLFCLFCFVCLFVSLFCLFLCFFVLFLLFVCLFVLFLLFACLKELSLFWSFCCFSCCCASACMLCTQALTAFAPPPSMTVTLCIFVCCCVVSLQDHPAGAAIILKYAGKDGTAAFDASGHPKDIVSQLGLDHLCLGDAEGFVPELHHFVPCAVLSSVCAHVYVCLLVCDPPFVYSSCPLPLLTFHVACVVHGCNCAVVVLNRAGETKLQPAQLCQQNVLIHRLRASPHSRRC